jgi:hypothetical protein
MPHNHEWQSRIKAVEREFVAMRQAADRFRQAALADPTILEGNLRYGEIVGASNNWKGHTSFGCSRSSKRERGSIGPQTGIPTRKRLI